MATPYKCPICDGVGTVPAGFYTRADTMTHATPEKCRACEGTGLVWDKSQPSFVPYVPYNPYPPIPNSQPWNPTVPNSQPWNPTVPNYLIVTWTAPNNGANCTHVPVRYTYA